MNIDNILKRIQGAGQVLMLEDWLLEKLSGFKNEWACDIEAKMDNGKLKHFNAVRVWHRSPHTDQPHKGGLRFHPDVNVDNMKAHAIEMSLKCWVMGLEWGGAKGGISIDPSNFSKQELKNITEAFVDEMDERNILGPFRDVPAPDVGTNPMIMNWIRQRYAQRRRSREDARFAGVVTGKPVGYGFGGIPGRVPATGYGLAEVLGRIIYLLQLEKSNFKRVAVMGFGNVGYHVAKFLAEREYDVVAISDVNGGIYRESGLSYSEISKITQINEFQNVDKISSAELLELKDIDVLVPAALENVITSENADKINAKIILEGANGPTTPEADEILQARGIIVIPDILANAGGVTVSFFEWARNVNIKDERVPCPGEDLVLKAMAEMLRTSADEVFKYSKKFNTSLRLAAYILAIEKTAPLFKSKHIA